MKKNRLLPFWLMPGSWGLHGKTRAIAEVEYYLEGIERDYEIAKIEHSNHPTKLQEAILQIDLQHKKITEEEFDRSLAKLNKTGEELVLEELLIDKKYKHISDEEYERKFAQVVIKDELLLKIANLDISLKYNKINQNEYEKEKATLNDQPWVGIKDSEFDHKLGTSGFTFELDFNEQFIKMLTQNGYRGKTEEEIVESWFNDLCSTIALEDGLFENPEDAQSMVMSLPKVNKTVIGPGKTEYS